MWAVAYGVTVEAAWMLVVRPRDVRFGSPLYRKYFWGAYKAQNRLYLESLDTPLPRGLLKNQPR